MFWLNGLAGIGKSTIARTIAEWAKKEDNLGGSFFFARDEKDLRDPTIVFPTLAYQLAKFEPSYKQCIAKTIEEDVDVTHKEITVQFDQLFAPALLAKKDPSTPRRQTLIILDALDECDDQTSVETILFLLLNLTAQADSRVCVFLTSRPEAHIRNVFHRFNQLHSTVVLHNIEDSIVRHDIEMYVGNGLSRVYETLGLASPINWPDRHQIDSLVDNCGKLFVYASTALRFIGDRRALNPAKRLGILLSNQASASSKSQPYANLDQLYLGVLQSAVSDDSDEEELNRIRTVIGIIVLLQDPLPIGVLSDLIEMEKEDISITLYHLHSLIIVPSPENPDIPPRFFHPSLPDFMTRSDRCTDPRFVVDVVQEEAYLCRRCLEVMIGNLHYNMIGIVDECSQNVEITDLRETLVTKLDPMLRYACKYWMTHLTNTKHGEVQVVEKLQIFARYHLLHWFEAMSLLESTTTLVSSMRTAHEWAVR